MSQLIKQLNIEQWSVDHVYEWLKGIQNFGYFYADIFKAKQINGKKLTIIELSDLADLVQSNLRHQVLMFKSIQNLTQFKHDIQNDSLQNLLFKTSNRLKSLHIYIEKIRSCSQLDCETCTRLKQDLVKQTGTLALTYRKLITWLIRLPFTRLKQFEKFRDDINFKMKNFFKTFRKKLNENNLDDLKQNINELMVTISNLLDYCETNCEKENGKISVAFNYSYLEKVVLRKKLPDQELGLTLISISEGISTIATIDRDSAADDCSRLNVEDDIIAVNNQIVVGWNMSCVNKLMRDIYDLNHSVYLLLRKMPKDHMISLKQHQNNRKNREINSSKKQNKTNNNSNNNNQTSQHQRRLSFSNIFISDDYLLDSSSEEEDDDDEKEDEIDFNNNEIKKTSLKNLNELVDDDDDKRKCQTLFEKSSSKGTKKTLNLGKLKTKNRLIRSMQNLLYDRSRSNSTDSLTNMDSNKSSKKNVSSPNSSKLDIHQNTKSDLFKSIFMNKKYDLSTNKKAPLSDTESADTPSLINVKRIDSIKRSQSNTNDEAEITKVSSKPPLNKRAYKISQKPTMQGWLFKPKTSNLSGSISNLSTSSSNLSSPSNSIIRHQINHRKWKRYWCVFTKDYITFYKQQDDKIPKDFLLLKDFSLVKSDTRKNGFILFDKMKQLEHEFYAETYEDFKEWYQSLSELRSKSNSDSLSQSSNSLSSSSVFDNINQSEVQSLPSSSSLGRKNNNLQLNLSTIADSNDDLNNGQNYSSSPPTNSSKNSPNLINNLNQSFNLSSRESSPGISSNKQSRDSSPSLLYPYMPDQDNTLTTSESDVENQYKTIMADNRQDYKRITSQNKLFSRKPSAVNTSISANASAGLIKSSCSPSPSSTTSHGCHFIYDEQTNKPIDNYTNNNSNNDINNNINDAQFQSRANSLPGSLQYCVGSLTTPTTITTNTSPSNQFNNTYDLNNNYNYKFNMTNLNSGLQRNQSVSSNSPKSPIFETSPIPNSPLLSSNQTSQIDNQLNEHSKNVQKYYIYHQPTHSSSQTQITKLPNTRKISVQLGANGITQINTYNNNNNNNPNSSNNSNQQQPFLITSINKPNSNMNHRNLPQMTTNFNNQSNQPVVYRTEIMILPSGTSTTNNNSNSNSNNNNINNTSNNSNGLSNVNISMQGVKSNQATNLNNSTSSSLPKYLASNSKDKVIRF